MSNQYPYGCLVTFRWDTDGVREVIVDSRRPTSEYIKMTMLESTEFEIRPVTEDEFVEAYLSNTDIEKVIYNNYALKDKSNV